MQTEDTEHVLDNRWELRETQPSPLQHLRDLHTPQEQFINHLSPVCLPYCTAPFIFLLPHPMSYSSHSLFTPAM